MSRIGCLRLLAAAVAAGLLAASGVAGASPAAGRTGADLGLYGQPIRFEAVGDTALRFGDVRYPGVLEVRRASSGELVVVNEVDMASYVEGIAEMPAAWPMEALRAQAVAARTYAWRAIQQGVHRRAGRGYDICDSTACQVYRGREPVLDDPRGQRWRRAVASTAGEVLMLDGTPILARYFSTSGGHTRDNEDAFADGEPHAYLRGVEDPDDHVSPLHHWHARFTREQFDRLLSRGRTLSATVPVGRVERIAGPEGGEDTIRVTGKDGTIRSVTADELQDFLNGVAPARFPNAFPGSEEGRAMPLTVPSDRFTPVVSEDAVVLHGNGWGHGVGMGQYGAKGKAERGLDHGEILAAYYGGIRPTTPAELPGTVRVGLRVTDGPARVSADGPFHVSVGDRRLAERATGTWEVARGSEATLRLSAPSGRRTPLMVAPTELREAAGGQAVRLETVVNKPVRLALEVVGPDGDELVHRPLGRVDPGRHAATWSLQRDGEPVPDGRYRARLAAGEGSGSPAGEPAGFAVAGGRLVEEAAVAPGAGRSRLRSIALALVMLSAAGVGVAGVGRLERS